MIYLMIKGGLVAPWEDEGYYMDLFWDNIISLTNNFITRGISVVIEYVIFEYQLKKIASFLKEKQIGLKYCVLMAKKKPWKIGMILEKKLKEWATYQYKQEVSF